MPKNVTGVWFSVGGVVSYVVYGIRAVNNAEGGVLYCALDDRRLARDDRCPPTWSETVISSGLSFFSSVGLASS